MSVRAQYGKASTASRNLCPFDDGGACDDFAESGIGCVCVAPDEVAADHRGLLGVAVVVGAVQGEVARSAVNWDSIRFSQDP